MVQIAITVKVSLFDELKDIVVTDHNVQILVEHLLDLSEAYQPLLFAVEKTEHIEGFILAASSIEPFLLHHVEYLRKGECFLV